jgi:hypothetical protein
MIEKYAFIIVMKKKIRQLSERWVTRSKIDIVEQLIPYYKPIIKKP